MRKPVIVAAICVAATLAAGFAFAEAQSPKGAVLSPERATIYHSCLHLSDAKFDGLNLDLLAGEAADQVALRNRAMRAHCDAYRANLTAQWNGFAESCEATASYSGLEGRSLNANSILAMRQVCTAMATSPTAAK